MHHESCFIDLIIKNIVVQTELKMDTQKIIVFFRRETRKMDGTTADHLSSLDASLCGPWATNMSAG